MRWLFLGLLISLFAMLVAAGAGAWHIVVQHRQLHAKTARSRDPNLPAVLDAEEQDMDR